MTVLVLTAVAGHAISGFAYLALDVLHRDREFLFQQEGPEFPNGILTGHLPFDANRIGPAARACYPDVSFRQKPARSPVYPDSRRAYPWSRNPTILLHVPSLQYQSRQRRTPRRDWISPASACMFVPTAAFHMCPKITTAGYVSEYMLSREDGGILPDSIAALLRASRHDMDVRPPERLLNQYQHLPETYPQLACKWIRQCNLIIERRAEKRRHTSHERGNHRDRPPIRRQRKLTLRSGTSRRKSRADRRRSLRE